MSGLSDWYGGWSATSYYDSRAMPPLKVGDEVWMPVRRTRWAKLRDRLRRPLTKPAEYEPRLCEVVAVSNNPPVMYWK